MKTPPHDRDRGSQRGVTTFSRGSYPRFPSKRAEFQMHLTTRLLGGAPKYPGSAQDYLHRPIRVKILSTTSASTMCWSNRETYYVLHNVDLCHQRWEMDPWNWVTDASFGGVSIIGGCRTLPICSHGAWALGNHPVLEGTPRCGPGKKSLLLFEATYLFHEMEFWLDFFFTSREK